MKKLCLLLICFSTFFTGEARAGFRDIVIDKLDFYYVDAPGSTLPSHTTMEVDKIAISQGNALTTALWTNADNSGLKGLLEALLKEPSAGGDARLQRVVATVLSISNKKVRVYLYHDNANNPDHSTMPIYCAGGGNYPGAANASWPCARMYSGSITTHNGEIGIGSYFFTSGANRGGYRSNAEKRMVFVHELVHTQTPLTLESSLTGNMYGPDGNHSYDELIPSKNSAFNEAIANAFAFRYHLPAGMSVTSMLNGNDKLVVENDASCSSATTHCLQHRLAADSVTAASACSANHKCYAIRDISPDVLMHNELVTANVLYQVSAQFYSTGILARAAKAAKTEMANGSNFTFMPYFKELTKQANNFRNRSNPAGTRTLGQYVPVAVLDYYTGYQIPDKATLNRVLGTTWATTDTNIDDYFRTHRAVLTGYRTNNTTWHVGNQISRLSQHLKVRPTSSAPTAATNNK